MGNVSDKVSNIAGQLRQQRLILAVVGSAIRAAMQSTLPTLSSKVRLDAPALLMAGVTIVVQALTVMAAPLMMTYIGLMVLVIVMTPVIGMIRMMRMRRMMPATDIFVPVLVVRSLLMTPEPVVVRQSEWWQVTGNFLVTPPGHMGHPVAIELLRPYVPVMAVIRHQRKI